MQTQRTTAGETAKNPTRPGWGIVAIAGLICACATIESSIMIALAGTTVFTFGAWKGGYMEGGAA